MSEAVTGPVGWKFSRPFWIANSVEVLERAAWYGVFVVITLYLTRVLCYTDPEATTTAGVFMAGLYLLPSFSGAYADRIGFRNSLLLAFGLLTIGYAGMWILPTLLESAGLVEYGVTPSANYLGDTDALGLIIDYKKNADGTGGLGSCWQKWLFIPVMLVIMVGGSFIKAVITGTVAKETTTANRARAFSIFYAMVNVGAFSGKTIVKPLRDGLGNNGLVVLNLFAAGMTLLAFLLVLLFYHGRKSSGEGKTFGEIWQALVAVCTKARLIILILIITGFWIVQHQLYASMPLYVTRMAGEKTAVSWLANINPAVVVVFVALITQLMRRRTALTSMIVGMFVMPLAALCMATGNLIDGKILGMEPILVVMMVGIGFQGIAECFISPRFLEYFSIQAPKGEEGLYLGFSHLHSFFSSLFGFSISGHLLDSFCPAPRTLSMAERAQRVAALKGEGPMPEAYAHAHYLWFVFVGIALVAAIALITYGFVTKAIDTRKAAAEA